MDVYIHWCRCRVMKPAGIVSLDFGRVGSGRSMENLNNVRSDRKDATK